MLVVLLLCHFPFFASFVRNRAREKAKKKTATKHAVPSVFCVLAVSGRHCWSFSAFASVSWLLGLAHLFVCSLAFRSCRLRSWAHSLISKTQSSPLEAPSCAPRLQPIRVPVQMANSSVMVHRHTSSLCPSNLPARHTALFSLTFGPQKHQERFKSKSWQPRDSSFHLWKSHSS